MPEWKERMSFERAKHLPLSSNTLKTLEGIIQEVDKNHPGQYELEVTYAEDDKRGKRMHIEFTQKIHQRLRLVKDSA